MPVDVTEELKDIAAEQGESIVQATYMSGAVYVRDRLHLWRSVLRDAKTDE